jgi:metal-dependent amidase/aminoacylase/carboxypeptidase family protein
LTPSVPAARHFVTCSGLAGSDNADMTLEELYKDLHAHPELAFAEHRTANIAAGWLDAAGRRAITPRNSPRASSRR